MTAAIDYDADLGINVLSEFEIDLISGGGHQIQEAFLVGAGAGAFAGTFIGGLPGAAAGALIGGAIGVGAYFL